MTAGDGKLGVRVGGGGREARWVVWSVEMREKRGREEEERIQWTCFIYIFFRRCKEKRRRGEKRRETWEECR